ncbi:FYDLN acid domain-containing protein [Croceibacterium sp. TMG7-5b_MA50]|uniref:FYDLN acid domain-containing protein n=1 Tax=Croceibacterium sp. TMG7-5b_MA50 TaxID=3121290 RepID=UPI00322218EF
MVKPEWGTKRTCPQTGERFYDLGNDNPVTSPNGFQWYPEPVLKSKQPIPYEEVAKKPVPENQDNDLAEDDDLGDIDEDEDSPDNDVDLGGDDDLGVAGSSDEDDEDN